MTILGLPQQRNDIMNENPQGNVTNFTIDAIEKRRQYQREYYLKNKYRLCNQTLNNFSINSIEKIQASCSGRVKEYMDLYP